MDKLLVIGHRGARGRLSENTLESFQYAIEVGAHSIEMDLCLTKDDDIIITHDLILNRKLCSHSNPIINKRKNAVLHLTVDELKQFDIGSKKNTRFPKQQLLPGAKLPTLKDVFDLVKNSKHPHSKIIRLNLEAKLDAHKKTISPNPLHFAKIMLQKIRESGLMDRITIQCFDLRFIEIMSTLEKQIELAPNTERYFVNLSKLTSKYNAPLVCPHWSLVRKKDVEALHAAGRRVVPWTANSIKLWNKLIEMNVDGIITDYPEELLHFIQEKRLHSATATKNKSKVRG